MKNYLYHAVDYSGRAAKGTIGSNSAEEASRELGSRGLFILSIREESGLLPRLKEYWHASQVQEADILSFAQNFSYFIEAGIPIIGCMDDLIASAPNPAFVPVLEDLRQRLERGGSVTEALAAHGSLFPDILKTLVAVGEETGSLMERLREAAEHLQRMQTLKGSVKRALMYPAFAFFATLGALTFWLAFVIPSLTSTLSSMGVKLPFLTRALIASSDLFHLHWKLLIVLLALTLFSVFLLGKHPKARYQMDRALIKTPIIEVIAFNKLMVAFCEQFRILIAAGINMDRLFDLIIPSLGNEYFIVNMRLIRDNVLSGARISDSFEQRNILPALALTKIRMGETTGTLDKQFEFLAKYYSKKLDDAIDSLGKIIEPVVMLVIGFLFVIIVMGLLLPIYDLVSKVGKT